MYAYIGMSHNYGGVSLFYDTCKSYVFLIGIAISVENMATSLIASYSIMIIAIVHDIVSIRISFSFVVS